MRQKEGKIKVLIVSGISGSGKSTFLKALEDVGFFCVDNLPLLLLDRVLEMYESYSTQIKKAAFVIDIREKEFLIEGKEVLKKVKEIYDAEIIFLDSSDEVLIRRFNQTRRLHPLSEKGTIREAIEEERRYLKWLKDISDKVLDTSGMSPHDLRNFVFRNYETEKRKMKISLVSFGYSYGVPVDGDIVIDVRFLPNPNYVPELKDRTGMDEAVKNYISSTETYRRFSERLWDLLSFLIPRYEDEGKSYLTICFGCTGGRHRSVFVVEDFSEKFNLLGYNVTAHHRDLGR